MLVFSELKDILNDFSSNDLNASCQHFPFVWRLLVSDSYVFALLLFTFLLMINLYASDSPYHLKCGRNSDTVILVLRMLRNKENLFFFLSSLVVNIWSCPLEGWFLAGDSCYLVSPNKLNWFEAQQVPMCYLYILQDPNKWYFD